MDGVRSLYSFLIAALLVQLAQFDHRFINKQMRALKKQNKVDSTRDQCRQEFKAFKGSTQLTQVGPHFLPLTVQKDKRLAQLTCSQVGLISSTGWGLASSHWRHWDGQDWNLWPIHWETRGKEGHVLGSYVTQVLPTARIDQQCWEPTVLLILWLNTRLGQCCV